MAQRSLSSTGFTPTPVADAVGIVDNTHMSLQGSGVLDHLNVSEIWIGGQAVASSVMLMVFARNGGAAGTPVLTGTNGKDAALQDINVAGVQRGYMSATTDPQRSATLGLLNMTFNAFGGIARWQCPQGKEISIIGSTASLGDASLSQFTGGTSVAVGAHVIYEPA